MSAPNHIFIELFKRGREIEYRKGEMILRAQDPPRGIYFMRCGYARLFSECADGKELTLFIYQPSDVFPVLWASHQIVQQQSGVDRPTKVITEENYYIECLSHVDVWRISIEEFITGLNSNPAIFLQWFARNISRFSNLLTRMECLAFGNAGLKVATSLTLLLEEFGVGGETDEMIQIPLTHDQIGALIGLTRETVSVEMKKLEEQGIVNSHRGRVRVKDCERLRGLSFLVVDR